MKFIAISALTAFIFLSNGCTTQKFISDSASIQFNYSIENGKEAGLIQVFDINNKTVLQIRDIDLRKPMFLDANGNNINYEIIGQYASLNGIHNYIRVIANNAYATVVRNKAWTPTHSASPILSATNSGNNLQNKPDIISQLPEKTNDGSTTEIKAEIDRLKKELADLREILAANQKSTQESNQSNIKLKKSTEIIRVRFKDNSIKFEPMESVKRQLLTSAKEASVINIVGYTDSNTFTKIAEAIAHKRATAAKSFLIANGIQDSKISIFLESYGKFIADNTTTEGRNENRRVEISLQ